ncbi:MAG TPA: sigma-70 family RNA polymerase sigma factor [Phycisphaerae bacterium]|nr:sigma-70 family RNA polymerase sigma factor [Phycisphaerae bacterium]
MGHDLVNSDDHRRDVELVRAVCAGDDGGYAALVDRHLASVYAVVARIVINRTDAEDLTQDTFVRAFERLALYDMERCFRNWILKIATNLAINHLRSQRRERVGRLRLAEERKMTANPASASDKTPSCSQWQHWLGQLDEMQRTAIVLFHFEQMPCAEIANVLDLPATTVRTHLHRGRRRLRELMSDDRATGNGSWTVAIQNG